MEKNDWTERAREAVLRADEVLVRTAHTRSSETLKEAGIAVALPGEDGQGDVMHLIYEDVKATRPAEMDRFLKVERELKEKGAQVIILGCTELSMIRRDESIGAGYLDAMQVLAKCAVEQCGTLKEECRQLITG